MRRSLLFITALALMYPSGFPSAQEAASEPIHHARAVLASTLDPALPAVPLDTWIRQIVGPSARYEWSHGACAGVVHMSRPAVGVCGIVLAATSEMTVTVAVRVGGLWPDEKAERGEPSRFNDAFIDRGHDSLPLERLGDLPRLLTMPPQQWPKREVLVEKDGIRCSQETPMVTCSLAIANPGQTAIYARVFTERRPYADQDSEFALKLQPGERRTMQLRLSSRESELASIAVGVELQGRSPYLHAGKHGQLTLRPRNVFAVREGYVDPPDDELPRDILRIRDAFTAPVRSVDVPVDGSVSRLVVSAELPSGVAATLFRPGGVAVAASDHDARFSVANLLEVGRATVASRTLFTVAAPEAGVWRLQMTAIGAPTSGSFAVTARGISATAFDSFDLVNLQHHVHGGYFQIKDAMPVAGTRIAGQARLSDPALEATFRLIDESGRILDRLDLKKDDHYSPVAPAGPLTVPAVPFFVVMEATDGSKGRIQRQYPALFRPQTVSVSFAFDKTQIPAVVAGRTRQFRYTVTNHGAATATFAPIVRTIAGEVRDVLPRTVSLQPGASATVTFSLVVPSNPEFHSIEMQLGATHTADPRVTNSRNVSLEIAPADDVDKDYVKNDVDNCPEFPNGDQHDADRDGIGDPCDPTPWSPVAILDFHPKRGAVGTTVTISGRAFGETAALNRVTFGAVPATILKATTTELVVLVPEGASNSLIYVHAPRGTVAHLVPFVVVNPAP